MRLLLLIPVVLPSMLLAGPPAVRSEQPANLHVQRHPDSFFKSSDSHAPSTEFRTDPGSAFERAIALREARKKAKAAPEPTSAAAPAPSEPPVPVPAVSVPSDEPATATSKNIQPPLPPADPQSSVILTSEDFESPPADSSPPKQRERTWRDDRRDRNAAIQEARIEANRRRQALAFLVWYQQYKKQFGNWCTCSTGTREYFTLTGRTVSGDGPRLKR